ncbi:mucin-2 [Streptomyces sp. SAI-127]|uniref:PP2C family protein-serine/threonine phosphatase n=1 Tax=Streptomyces sp. SAI-127 TaxID=2940543 RepID=UPI002475997F|nr:mucin-2 [Streptomyces sp. SAI-127]MDH6489631.1 serine/threonine protein phosphatase PrpC [Streptomyces sp. SAI-127]
MRNYATHQSTGGRDFQCDATAVATIDGVRAYALLDGIGDKPYVRDWTRAAARRLARTAARLHDAETGLRHERDRYAREDDRQGPWAMGPKACALVAVEAPGLPLTVAWSGDVRAYWLVRGTLRPLTQDHNLRRVYPPCETHDGGSRHRVTSCLGSVDTDQDLMNEVNHPAVEAATISAERGRLLLACDGAYEPHEDAGHRIGDLLYGTPAEAARRVVKDAVATARTVTNRPDNATALVADLYA